MAKKAAWTLRRFLDLQKDTALYPVNQCILTGDFAPPPDEKIGENETVVGELTLYEKALYTAVTKLTQGVNGLIDRPGDSYALRIAKGRENHAALEAILWASIKNRLDADALADGHIGIRDNYVLVRYRVRAPIAGLSLSGSIIFGSP